MSAVRVSLEHLGERRVVRPRGLTFLVLAAAFATLWWVTQ